MKGTSEKLRQYDLFEVDKGLRKVLGGNYVDIEVTYLQLTLV